MRHPVPEPLLARIGDITVSFALLELQLQGLAQSFIQDSQRVGQIITAEFSFRNLRALVVSLYLERHGEDTDFGTLRELMKRARQVEEERNQIAHSVWGAGEGETITRIKTTARETRGVRHTFESWDAKRLGGLATEILAIASEIQSFDLDLIERGKAINDRSVRLWPVDG